MKQAEYITRAQRVIRLANKQIRHGDTAGMFVVLLAIVSTAKYIIGKSDVEPVEHFNQISRISK